MERKEKFGMLNPMRYKYLLCTFSRDVDPSKALSLPGVRAYVGAADVPGNNQIGIIIKDEEVFAKDKVRGVAIKICLNFGFFVIKER